MIRVFAALPSINQEKKIHMTSERKKTILLVEDESIIAMAEKKALEKYGFDVITAHSGEKAVEDVAAIPAIDLVLMDINLGSGIDGTVAAEKILKKRDLPLIFLSSHLEREVVEKTEGITSYGYIVKSAGETVLIASIKMAFRLFEAKMKELEKEEALFHVKNDWEETFDSITDMVTVHDKDFNIIRSNKAAERILGLPLLEKNPDAKCFQYYHGTGNPPANCPTCQCLKTCQPCSFELFEPHLNRHLEIRAIPRFDRERNLVGLIHVARDITERKQADEALRQSGTKLRNLYENMVYGVFHQMADGTLVDINPAGLEMFGITKDQFLGRSSYHPEWKVVDEKFNRLKPEQHPSMVALRTAQKTDMVVGVFNPAKQGYRWLSVCAQPQCKQGEVEPCQVFVTMHDITGQKQAQEKINILLQEKELLLKETHHHVKNNMNVINGLLVLQANAQENKPCKNILLDAAGRVQSMMVLYDKLYRSENFRELSLQEFLKPLIAEIVGIFHPPVKTTVELEDFALSATVLSPIGIIINELITNSMKHAFPDIKEGIIRVSAKRKGNKVSIIYQDNGIGLPESISFENSPTFGMQLVQLLVKQINGSFTIERKKGTKIIIEFAA
jgi:PAS domain S-box-containing protein